MRQRAPAIGAIERKRVRAQRLKGAVGCWVWGEHAQGYWKRG